MKRLIKASFGYRDEDWVDPDPEMSEPEYGSLYVDCTGGVIQTDKDGDVVSPDSSIVDPADIDVDDPEHHVEVVDQSTAADLAIDQVFDKFYDKFEPNSTYELTGGVVIPYTVWVPTSYAKSRVYYDRDLDLTITSDDVELGPDPVDDDLSIKKIR